MFKLNDRVALKTEVAAGKANFFRIKKILEDDNYVIGKCSCRPDLYITMPADALLAYEEAKTILSEGMFE